MLSGFHIVHADPEPAIPILNQQYIEAIRGTTPYTFDYRYPSYRLASSQIADLQYLGIETKHNFHFIGGLIGTQIKGSKTPTVEQLLELTEFIEDMLFGSGHELFLELNGNLLSRYYELQTKIRATNGHCLTEMVCQLNQTLEFLGSGCLPAKFISSVKNQAYFKQVTAPLIGRYCISVLNPNRDYDNGLDDCISK